MTSDTFNDFVLDQLREIPQLQARAMFGGHGLYAGKQFFGILHCAQLYFATNSQTVRAYLDRGMQPFRPNARQTLANYYEVPPEIVENREALVEWAKLALAARPARARASRSP